MKSLQNEAEGGCLAKDITDRATAHSRSFHGQYDAIFFLQSMTKLVKEWYPVTQLLLECRNELGGCHVTGNSNALQNRQRRPSCTVTVCRVLTEFERIQLDGKIFDRTRGLMLET